MKHIKSYISRYLGYLVISILALTMDLEGQNTIPEYGEYQLRVHIGRVKNTGNDSKSFDMNIKEIGGGNNQLLNYSHGKIDGGDWSTPLPDITKKYDTQSSIPTAIYCESSRCWSVLFGTRCHNGSGTVSFERNKPYTHKSVDVGVEGRGLFPNMYGSLELQFHPYRINLYYFPNDGAKPYEIRAKKFLPFDETITLKATKGFIPATYNWVYYIGTPPQSQTDWSSWKKLPATVKYNSERNEVSFSGKDLVSSKEEFIRAIQEGKPIHIRINIPTEEQNQLLTLTPTLSVPHITSVSTLSPKCHGEANGELTFTLDRALLDGEVLQVEKDGAVMQIGEGSRIHLNTQNQFTITGLSAGSYHFKLSGSIPSSSGSVVSYNEHPNHQRNITITERPAISVHVSQRNINCYQGEDGQIEVIATGGTESYTATLIDATGKKTSIKGKAYSPIIFGRLRAGKYQVELIDSHACTQGTSPKVAEITLTEPPIPVTIEQVAVIPPKAHNSSDGLISINVSGGTVGSNAYKVVWKNAQGQSFSSTSTSRDGDKYTYVLSGIPSGIYTAMVSDSRYDNLNAEDKNEPCGCFALQRFELIAPPPLSVSIEETHFINCQGSNEGELNAKTEGGVPFATGDAYRYQWYQIKEGVEVVLSGQTAQRLETLYAGKYLVEITDANQIKAKSAIYTLEEPTALRLSFEVNSPNCSSGKGHIRALVQGGTPPYRYQWNVEGVDKADLEEVVAGNYFLRVTDSRGCTIEEAVELNSPSPLKVTHKLQHPSCFGERNGSIELQIEGGTSPYHIRWSDGGEQDLYRKGLTAGQYQVTISDSQNCPKTLSFELTEPQEIKLSLTPPFSLCKGQARYIEASCSVSDVQYTWLLNGVELPTKNSRHRATQGGRYTVIASNSQGCNQKTEAFINEVSSDFILDIAMPSVVEQGAEIHAINISKTPASKIEWILPTGATLIRQSDDELLFSIEDLGHHTLTVLAHTDNCTVELRQIVEVKARGDASLPKAEQELLIKQFIAYPNPTQGHLQIKLEFREASDYTLSLYSLLGDLLKQEEGKLVQNTLHNLHIEGYTSGTYILVLNVAGERANLKIQKQ